MSCCHLATNQCSLGSSFQVLDDKLLLRLCVNATNNCHVVEISAIIFALLLEDVFT